MVLKRLQYLIINILLLATISNLAFADITIHEAVENEDFQTIKQLIESDIDINAKNESQKTPLYIAARNGNKDIVTLLLENGSNENQITNKELQMYFDSDKSQVMTQGVMKQQMFIRRVMSSGGKGVVDVFDVDDPNIIPSELLSNNTDPFLPSLINSTISFARAGTPVDTTFDIGSFKLSIKSFMKEVSTSDTIFKVKEPAIFRALKNDRINTVENLLGLESNINIKDDDGNSPLHVSVIHCLSEMADMLIKRGTEINGINYSGETPLYLSKDCDIDFVSKLLNKGADVNRANDHGNTPLINAIENGRIDVVKFFLKNNASIDVKNEDNMNLIHIAAINGEEDIISLLIAEKIDVNEQGMQGNTALHFSVSKGHKTSAQILIDSGAKINVKNNEGDTPLHLISKRRAAEIEIVKLLINNGADGNVKNNSSYSPFRYAVIKNKYDIIKLLINDLEDINEIDKEGKTLLYEAVENGYDKIVKLLLDTGANPNIFNSTELYDAYDNSYGNAPLHIAAKYNNIKIAKLLIENAADKKVKNSERKTPRKIAKKNKYKEMTKLLK